MTICVWCGAVIETPPPSKVLLLCRRCYPESFTSIFEPGENMSTIQKAWTDLEAEIANAVRAGVDATLGRMPSKNHKLVVALVSAAREEGYKAGRADMREEAAKIADQIGTVASAKRIRVIPLVKP